MRMPGPGHLFILVGAGGSGKTTLIKAVREAHPEVRFMPTTTTRPPRPGEVNGREYDFVDEAMFDRLRQDRVLLEWAEIHGHTYGTSRKRIEELLESGEVGITSLDYHGAFAVKETFPERSTTIFVHPLSVEDLRARLRTRNDTSIADIEKRLARAAEEGAQAQNCDYDLLNANGRFEEALSRLLEIMEDIVGSEALSGHRR